MLLQIMPLLDSDREVLTALTISLAVQKKALMHTLSVKETKSIRMKKKKIRRNKLLPVMFADMPFVSKKSRG
jgi:hypothetical protein